MRIKTESIKYRKFIAERNEMCNPNHPLTCEIVSACKSLLRRCGSHQVVPFDAMNDETFRKMLDGEGVMKQRAT